MATRIYLPSDTGSPGITPTPATEWEFTTGFTRFIADTVKVSSAMTSVAVTDSTATANRDALAFQYITHPLAVGTAFATTGTIKGQMRVMENATGNNLRSQVIVRVMASDGSTVRATLYAGDTTTGTTNPTSEWGTSLANRQMPRGATVAIAANYTSVSGDRLVIEIGYRKHAAASTIGTFSIGDNAATDLAEDETTTTANNPWIEFSNTFTVVPPPGGNRRIPLTAAISTVAAGVETVVLEPLADTWVEDNTITAGAGAINHGTETGLEIDYTQAGANGSRFVFMKFDLGPTTITSNSLRLYWTNRTAGTAPTYHIGNDNSWTETGLTFDNAPTYGTAQGSLTVAASVPLATTQSLSGLPTTGVVTLVFAPATNNTDGMVISSREDIVANRPTLTITRAFSTTTTTTRNVPLTASISVANLSRTVPLTAKITTPDLTRSIPLTANISISGSFTRNVPLSGVVRVTTAKTVPLTGHVLVPATRTVPMTAAVRTTATRSVPLTADIYAVPRLRAILTPKPEERRIREKTIDVTLAGGATTGTDAWTIPNGGSVAAYISDLEAFDATRTIQVIGDLHEGDATNDPNRRTVMTTDSANLNSRIVQRVFIGDLADSGQSTERTTIKGRMDSIGGPTYRIVYGNHDFYNSTTLATLESFYGRTGNWYEDIGTDIRLIGLSPSSAGDIITLSTATLDWMEARLSETTRICLLFVHAPFYNSVQRADTAIYPSALSSIDTNYYVRPDPDIYTRLDAHSNAKAWFSGHVHAPLISPQIMMQYAMPTDGTMIAVSVSSISRPGKGGSDTGRPNATPLITVTATGLEIRWRNHDTGGWFTVDGNLITKMPWGR